MTSWVELDQEIVARVRQMVVDALGAMRTLEMALELIRQTLRWADALIEAFEAAHPLPRPVVCEAGCPYCCHNQVEATLPEVILVAQILRQFFAPHKLEKIKERILRAAAFKIGKTKEELALTRLSHPCPLLEEHKCLIYPWRPLMCRAMHSLNREHCRTSLSLEDLQGEEFYLHRYTFALSLGAGLRQGFQAAGCQAPVVDLTNALARIILEPLLPERWLKGERVFPESQPPSGS